MGCDLVTAPQLVPTGTIWQRISAEQDRPLFASVELTWRCNLRCAHCYLPTFSSPHQLSTGELLNLFDQLAHLGVMVLTFTGGEATLRPDFDQLVDEALARHFVVQIKSNGVHATPHQVARWGLAGVYEFNVSLYHTDGAAHDGFVGHQGAFDKSVASLEAFAKTGQRVRVSVVLMDWNLGAGVLLERFCEERGWPISFDVRISPRNDGNPEPRGLSAAREPLADAILRIPTLRKRAQTPPLPKNPDGPVCGIGQSSVVVQPDGKVLPCVSTPSLVLGNIRERPLEEIWVGSKTRQQLLKVTHGQSKSCRNCKRADICTRCPANALMENIAVEQASKADCEHARVWQLARLKLKNGQ